VSGAAILVAHGSADPRAAATTRALVRAVAAARPGLDVRPAYLEHAGPRPGEVLAALAGTGHPGASVVPLLLTAAYHGRVDLPAVLAAARGDGLTLPVRMTDVLGPVGGVVPAPLLAGLRRRLAELDTGYDAVVLAAAGTRDAQARTTVVEAATALGAALGVPCQAGYASAAGPAAGEAVSALRAAGARRVAVAAYFLATGRLYRTAADSARAAGAVAVAAPLGAARELAHLVLARLDRVSQRGTPPGGGGAPRSGAGGETWGGGGPRSGAGGDASSAPEPGGPGAPNWSAWDVRMTSGR
jgi:sirohydrochlorin ferrochelatase